MDLALNLTLESKDQLKTKTLRIYSHFNDWKEYQPACYILKA